MTLPPHNAPIRDVAHRAGIPNHRFGRLTMPIMQGLEAVLAPLGIRVVRCKAAEPARPPLTSAGMNLVTPGAGAGRSMAAMIGRLPEHGLRLLRCSLVIRAATVGMA